MKRETMACGLMTGWGLICPAALVGYSASNCDPFLLGGLILVILIVGPVATIGLGWCARKAQGGKVFYGALALLHAALFTWVALSLAIGWWGLKAGSR